MAFTRKEILTRLRKLIDEGKPIVGAGAGTGISAKFEEAGGVDLIVIYNSGKFRMAGRGSMAGLLPYGDANAIVMEMGHEVLPVVKDTPVLAGVCGTDPFRLMDVFLKQVRDAGFSGVQNFPTVGVYDGDFRKHITATGFGYELEVEMVRMCREMDFFTTPYVFNTEEAKAMAGAGADVIVAHLGLTTKGSIGAAMSVPLEEAPGRIQEMCDAARGVNPDVMCICHGGPIADPEDAEYVLKNTTGVQGYYGASSVERLPVETAIKKRIEQFKAIKF